MYNKAKISFVLQDYLGACIVFTAAVSSITSGLYGYVSPAIVGLAIAYALMVIAHYSIVDCPWLSFHAKPYRMMKIIT